MGNVQQITKAEVESATGNEVKAILSVLSESEKDEMLIFLAGYSPLAFTAAYNLSISD